MYYTLYSAIQAYTGCPLYSALYTCIASMQSTQRRCSVTPGVRLLRACGYLPPLATHHLPGRPRASMRENNHAHTRPLCTYRFHEHVATARRSACTILGTSTRLQQPVQAIKNEAAKSSHRALDCTSVSTWDAAAALRLTRHKVAASATSPIVQVEQQGQPAVTSTAENCW